MRYFILLLAVFFSTFVSKAQDNRIKKFDSLFSSLYHNHLFSGSVLIAEGGKTLYQQAFGLADIDHKKKLNTHTVFELASVSKQFTATAILQLAEQQKLSFDDSLGKFFPQLPYQGVTIKQLLNHTGGEPDYFDVVEKHWDKTKIIDNKTLITLLSQYPPKADFAPGTDWAYSNTGYMLLASIIEKVSELDYETYLKKNIFEPLGMKHSFVYTRRYAPQKINNYALGYEYNDSLQRWELPDSLQQTRFVYYMDGVVGDGCVNSNTEDLLKWDRALYTEQVLSKKWLQQAFTPTVLPNGKQINYGFGWSLYENAVYGKVVNHSGGWPGYMTWFFRYIDKDKTVIILCNKMLPLKGLTNAVEHILFNEPYEYPVKRQK